MVVTLKMFKAWGGRVANQQWVNVYHVNVPGTELAIEAPEWLALVNALAEQEGTFHLAEVNFMRATISTMKAEAVYDPRTLRVIELAGVGQRGRQEADVPCPLDMALKVKKAVSFGRAGTMFYRGALTMSQISSAAGGNTSLKSPIDNNLVSSVANIITNTADELAALDATLCMPPKIAAQEVTGFNVRVIQALQVSGLSLNKRNHAWFDRKAKAVTPDDPSLGDSDGDGIPNYDDPDSPYYVPPEDGE